MRKRVAIIALNVAVLLSIVGGTAAYAAFNKTVTLSVDGKETSVRTFGSTVSDVLEAEDIDLGEHDVVAPEPDAEIEDGSRVAVRYGRQLTVTIDGKKKTYWVTADSVGKALDQLGLRVDDAKLSTSRSTSVPRDGLALRITRPKTVTIKAGGHKKKIETTRPTVQAALNQADVTVDKNDEVKPKPGKKVRDGLTIDITRIKVVKRTKTVSIDADTKVREDDEMYEDKTKVVREGRDGEKKLKVRIVKADGDVRSRKVLDKTVTTKARDRVEKHGTKEREVSTSDGGDSDGGGSGGDSGGSDSPSTTGGGPWDRLAECESGGNWSINSGNGYYGGLQFDAQTWHAHGGSGLPHEHSRAEQIAVAEKVRDARGGYGAWPACSSELGLPQ